VGSEMAVANGGMLYALGINNGGWVWSGGGWHQTSAPTLPPPPTPPLPVPSPDGSILSGALQTQAGAWTFGAAYPGAPGNWYINLNRQNASGGAGSEMVVAYNGQLYVLGIDGNWWVWQNGIWHVTSNPLVNSGPPPATLTLTFNPQTPSLPNTSPLGTVVATVTAAWSNGSPFTGTLAFGQPYADDGGTFALSCGQCATAQIVLSPAGLGIMGDGGTVQNITIVATQ